MIRRSIYFQGRVLVPCIAAIMLCGCVAMRETGFQGSFHPDTRVGSVAVDSVARCVIATGFVNQVSGLVELLACGPGGKRHESVFVMQTRATDLQAALLLIGCKAGEPMPGLGQAPPRGSPVEILVARLAEPGTWRRAEDFIESLKGKPFNRASWVFTGSVIAGGRFKALAEESYVATFWDPWAIINFGHPSGADDMAIVAREHADWPVGEPVLFAIRGSKR